MRRARAARSRVAAAGAVAAARAAAAEAAATGLRSRLQGARAARPRAEARRRPAQDPRERRFWPTARISWALPIFDRPSMSSLAASRRSSVTVMAPAPLPVPFDAPRLRAAAFAPSRPSALRVLRESLVMVFFCRAPFWAFLTFFRAACRCFWVAMAPPRSRDHEVHYPREGRGTPRRLFAAQTFQSLEHRRYMFEVGAVVEDGVEVQVRRPLGEE